MTSTLPNASSVTVAADLMSLNPVSIRGGASLEAVVAFLTETGFSAAPVIDDSGRPIGVVSRTDVVVYQHARSQSDSDVPGFYEDSNLSATVEEMVKPSQAICAADLMTPAVYSVTPDTPVLEVAAKMANLNVHRLFVVDDDGVLVGVLSALDLLGYLATGRRRNA